MRSVGSVSAWSRRPDGVGKGPRAHLDSAAGDSMTKPGDRTSRDRTLAARLEQRDRDVFVGREPELELLERCLAADATHVVFLHGPGGIGKSTLLREIARRARERGWDTFLVEGRELAPTPDAIETLLAPASESAN